MQKERKKERTKERKKERKKNAATESGPQPVHTHKG